METGIGSTDDSISLTLGGKEINITESYEVKVSVIQQPSAFSLRLGSNVIASELLSMSKPNTEFALHITPKDGLKRTIQSGKIDARSVPSANFTQVEIRGRDWLAALFDTYVEEEQTFPEKTFLNLTRTVMNICGLTPDKGHFLQFINDFNRQRMTGVKAPTIDQGELVSEINTGSMSGTGELVYKTMKVKLGTRYYEFLLQQYKLAGLFLWACPDKTFVLARPHANQPASYNIFRDRLTGKSNVLDCSFKDDTTMRHSEAIVYGRSGGGKKGVETCRGSYVDDEMLNYGFDKKIIIHDTDVKTKADCEYVARRMLADERRAGWQLEYTLAGHVTPSPLPGSGSAVWAPDTVVHVEDSEIHVGDDPALQTRKDFYVEAVTYSRGPSGTITKLHLMRPGDLIFASSLQDDGTLIKRKGQSGKGAKTVH